MQSKKVLRNNVLQALQNDELKKLLKLYLHLAKTI